MGLGYLVTEIGDHNERIMKERMDRELAEYMAEFNRKFKAETENAYRASVTPSNTIPYANTVPINNNNGLIKAMERLTYQLEEVIETIQNMPSPVINLNLTINDTVNSDMIATEVVDNKIREAIIYY